jgi:hypothetical protein
LWSNSLMPRTPIDLSRGVSRSAGKRVSDHLRSYTGDGERARSWRSCTRRSSLSIGREKARLGRPTRSWSCCTSPMPRTPMDLSGGVSRSAGSTSQTTYEPTIETVRGRVLGRAARDDTRRVSDVARRDWVVPLAPGRGSTRPCLGRPCICAQESVTVPACM